MCFFVEFIEPDTNDKQTLKESTLNLPATTCQSTCIYVAHDVLQISYDRTIRLWRVNAQFYENDVSFSNDTGILGKRNSEFSQQESNLRHSDY